MKKQLAFGTFVSLVVVMALAASANAYSDAISVNLAPGGGSNPTDGVVGLVNTTPQGGSLGNWMNMTGGTSILSWGDGNPYANFAAQADLGGWYSGLFDQATPLTATGAGVGSFRIDLYDGGWGANSYWNDPAQTVNTLGRTGISNGDMPNNWGPTGLGLTISNVPASFQAAGYDVYALMGSTQNSGASLTWIKLNSAPLTSANAPTYSFNSQGMRSLAAIQVLAGGAGPAWPDYLPGDFNKDGEVGPEDFGILKDNFGLDSLPFGNHQSWTIGDANDDGEIGPEDFGILKDNFGLDGGPTGTYPLANVPEPTTLALLALAGLAIRRKRR